MENILEAVSRAMYQDIFEVEGSVDGVVEDVVESMSDHNLKKLKIFIDEFIDKDSISWTSMWNEVKPYYIFGTEGETRNFFRLIRKRIK